MSVSLLFVRGLNGQFLHIMVEKKWQNILLSKLLILWGWGRFWLLVHIFEMAQRWHYRNTKIKLKAYETNSSISSISKTFACRSLALSFHSATTSAAGHWHLLWWSEWFQRNLSFHKVMVSSQEVMLLDKKISSASGHDPNHAVQRTGFP